MVGFSETVEKRQVPPTEKLHPKDFIDADGTQRQLFTFETKSGNQVGAVFYSKEDLPFNAEIVRGKQAFVFGDKPNFRDETEWRDFLQDLSEASDNKDPLNRQTIKVNDAVSSNNAVIFVENTPVNILDLAFVLGAEGKHLRDARKQASQMQYTDEVLSLIDDMVAVSIIGEDGKVRHREDQIPEALTVLKILADSAAIHEIQKRKKVVDDLDRERAGERQRKLHERYEELRLEGVVPAKDYRVYHTTRYKPKKVEGGWEIQTTYDATGGKTLVDSIHFNPNQAVDSHIGGSWDDAEYVIDANLKDIVMGNRDNARLRTISPFDIYFTVSPGRRLFIPRGHLTRPGSLEAGLFQKDIDDETVYKKGTLLPQEIDSFLSKHWHSDKDDWRIKRELEDGAFSALYYKLPEKERIEMGPDSEFRANFQDFIENWNLDEFFRLCRTDGIKVAVEEALKGYKNIHDINDTQAIIKKVNEWFITKIRNRSMYPSPQMAWGQGNDQRIEMLACELGARFDSTMEAHFHENFVGSIGSIYHLFKRVAERKKYFSGSNADLEYSNPNWMYDDESQSPLNPNNREEVMIRIRRFRKRYSYDDDVNLRRMNFLAGIL